MLKLYVETMIRLNGSTDSIKRSIKERKESESGFVSAETVGLAVAGVLIVAGLYVAFQKQLNDQVTKLFENMNFGGGDTDPTAPPAT